MGPPSAVRPRSTVAKAHSATDEAAGSGSGKQHAQAVVAEPWLSRSTSTRTRSSPARSSSVVRTSTSAEPARAPSTTPVGSR